MIKIITVLGGSGFIGRTLAVRLARAGYAVRLLTRTREHTKSLWTLPDLDVREIDVYDAAPLTKALAGSAAVINLVGILRETPRQTFVRTHVLLSQEVVAACAEAGVTRLLHMSALNADPAGPSDYLRSKSEGEAAVRTSNLHWTIFQPSVVFGPDDGFLNLFARWLPRLPLLPVPSAQTRFQPVYVGDVADAFCRALSRGSTVGKTLPLGGPRVYRLDELLRWLGKTIGSPRPVFSTPAALAPLQAWLLEHLPGQLMTRDQWLSMQKDSVCPDEKATALIELGVTPTALEEVAPRWLRSLDRSIP
ncbi:MAG: complex I NDUFA9 subunit family protein [Burkholderiales bacterium]|jgi:NADH dehydrogenase|nr:complex I NDUFA9 subunit family protein [Burkholderiales bacterium]